MIGLTITTGTVTLQIICKLEELPETYIDLNIGRKMTIAVKDSSPTTTDIAES